MQSKQRFRTHASVEPSCRANVVHGNAVAAIALAVVACAFAFTPRGEGASDASTSQPAAETAPAVGPIAYYVASCARCHGDVSAAYVGLDHPKRGDALKQVIDDMATGPAQAPLDAPGLKDQTALHEAMFGKTPFVWVDPGAKGRIAGEVLSGTTLTFQPSGADRMKPTVTDNRFDFSRVPGVLIGSIGSKTVEIPVK